MQFLAATNPPFVRALKLAEARKARQLRLSVKALRFLTLGSSCGEFINLKEETVEKVNIYPKAAELFAST